MTSTNSVKQTTSDQNSISSNAIIQHLKLSGKMSQVLTEVMNQKIIEQTAVRENIIPNEQELQVAADRFRLEQNLISSTDTLNWLRKSHLSVTDFEELIKQKLLCQKLAQHLFQSQVEAYYHTHQLDYYQAIIYEIVLSDFDLGMELYYGLQERELSFWNLAHQYIEERELRRKGGYQGKKSRQQMHPEIAAAVFSQKMENLPQVIKPVAVEKKTHLIYVEEIIQPRLDESLRQTILNRLFDRWLAQQNQQIFNNS